MNDVIISCGTRLHTDLLLQKILTIYNHEATFFLFVGLRYTEHNFKVRRSGKKWTSTEIIQNFCNFQSVTTANETLFLNLKDQITCNSLTFIYFKWHVIYVDNI